MRRLISLFLVAAVVLFGLGAWLFPLRKDDPLPAHGVNAVVVLAGSNKRLPVALDLMRRRVARTLVVSETSQTDDPARFRLCRGPKPRGYRLICRRAEPFSTRGEARMTAALVTRNHWRSLVIVSSRYHLFRAKRLFARCTSAKLVMRGADGDRFLRKVMSIPFEWGKFARSVTLQRGC
jgi:uncharacterized SAM-binding protein YcdF (DUF218 family)